MHRCSMHREASLRARRTEETLGVYATFHSVTRKTGQLLHHPTEQLEPNQNQEKTRLRAVYKGTLSAITIYHQSCLRWVAKTFSDEGTDQGRSGNPAARVCC